MDDFVQQTASCPPCSITPSSRPSAPSPTDIRAGSTTNRGWTIDAKENPGGFYLIMFTKGAFACFAGATLLHGLGLIGDPATWVHETFPFLKSR